QLHTQHLPTTPLQQKNDRYPPKGRATIAHQSINVCTNIFRMNSGKNNCFSSAFAISGMRRPNENISPVAKRYVRFGSSGTPSNSTSSTRSTPSSSKYVSTCKFANTRRPTTSPRKPNPRNFNPTNSFDRALSTTCITCRSEEHTSELQSRFD